MKQLILFFVLLTVIIFNATAQTDIQTSIITANGVFTVSKTNDGKDMIRLSIANWDEMMSGTKCCSYNLSVSVVKKFCIEIADKTYGCKKGIGFGCGIFDCPYSPSPLPNRVNNENRICEVAVIKLKGSVKVVFIDHVDWLSLQNNIKGMDY